LVVPDARRRQVDEAGGDERHPRGPVGDLAVDRRCAARSAGGIDAGIADTKGASDLYVLQNTIQPGGTFGWHSHPGPSLVIVKSGTATFYMKDDPTCSPQVVQAGSGFVDNGHDTHVVRNEGNVDLVTVVVSLVPAGFQRRIDEPAPANCPALPNG
jgi:quercetin dioxygenase-like cupin family protein